MREDEIKEVKKSIKEKIYGKDFNKNRSRYYGLRVGDIVRRHVGFSNEKKDNTIYKVVQYGFGDNNRIYLKAPTGEIIKEVAEWCTIISKVEEIKK
jgi:hypothetical protein